MISLRDVTKVFTSGGTSVAAVANVSLEIDRGDVFGIIGYSGAGKSTLIRLLNGLERPGSGTVRVNGADIGRASASELRRLRPGIGMIFQHFNLLWSRTVLANVMLPMQIAGMPKAGMRERALELIRLVGLEGRENAYPSQLSGGQKQRVGIARALTNRPEVLLCDEATSALDPETTDQILDLLARINRELGLTIVLITHEMHVVRRICNRVAVMEAGKVVETGPVSEVFRDPQQPITQRFLRQLIEETGDCIALHVRHDQGVAIPFADLVLAHDGPVTLAELLSDGTHVLRLGARADGGDALIRDLREAGFDVKEA